MEPGAKPKLGSGDRDETLSQSLANLSLNGLGPQWIRPFPPRYPVRDSEVRVCGENYLIFSLIM